MPFGRKKDDLNLVEIDFDQIYEEVICPIADEVDVELIRADEERIGGIIHVPMFERLLLAEIVIADLTVSNPNVFYELGVRHCAKPRSTILIFSDDTKLPFDLSPIRGVPYKLKNGKLDEKTKNEFKTKLKGLLETAKSDLETKDSPLFQLISQFPGIELPHDVTESFRDRVEDISNLQNKMREIRSYKNFDKAVEELKEIENTLGEINHAPLEMVIDLFLSYRDVNGYDYMIALYEKIPKNIKISSSTLREQYAFALNRRNKEGDRQKAIDTINDVIDQYGNSPESCGILGRIYKDKYEESLGKNNLRASANLKKAIETYEEGFRADPRDFYPGINVVTLSYLNNQLDKVKELTPIVSFAVTRRGGLNSQNYWEVATVLELAILNEEWTYAKRALEKMIVMDSPTWNYETTYKNLKKIKFKRIELTKSVEELNEFLEELAKNF